MFFQFARAARLGCFEPYYLRGPQPRKLSIGGAIAGKHHVVYHA
jgi:hypothetical protein